MKKYMMVTKEELEKLLDSFSCQEEFQEFIQEFSVLIEEIIHASNYAHYNGDRTDLVATLVVKQIFFLAVFCRNNMDMIHELVGNLEYTQLTEEQKKGFEQEGI